MHEAHLISDLIRKIECVVREQKAKRAVGIKVKLGALSHMTPGHFREHFEDASRHTAAEGALVEVEMLSDITDPHAQEILLEDVTLES